jgi:hypothetical protein
MIDHLVYASADLPSASAHIADRFGTTPTPGGSHVGQGTYNELLSLGGATYLEIIGPDPAQPEPSGRRPFGIDQITAPALVAWCVRPEGPLTEVVAAALTVGVDFGAVAPLSRRRPDGVLLEWSLTYPQLDGPFGCALPFLIDWGESAHPTDSLPRAAQLLELDVTHPHPDSLRPVLDILGLAGECTLHVGQKPALAARISTPRGEVTLSS